MEINEVWQMIGSVPFSEQIVGELGADAPGLMVECDRDAETVWIYRRVA